MQDTYNKNGFVTAIAALIINVLFFVYVSFIHPGVVGVDSVGKQSPKPVPTSKK